MRKAVIILSLLLFITNACKQEAKKHTETAGKESIIRTANDTIGLKNDKDEQNEERDFDSDEEITEKQTSMEENNDTYYLDGYLINPTKKQVGVWEMTGGSMPGGGQWDGYKYTPDKTINYNKTTLFIVGNQIFFKEHIKFFPKLDLNTLQVILTDLDSYADGYFLARDKNHLYLYSIGNIKNYNGQYKTIDISNYQTINNYIYKKGSSLYFLSKYFELKKVDGVSLDISTVEHLTDNYFTDKNGLYLLGGYVILENGATSTYEKSIQLEKSNGKKITPIVTRNYFIYGDKVYSPADYNNQKPLPLNAGKIKELEIYSYDQRYFLADDNHTFETENDKGYVNTDYDTKIFNQIHDDYFKKNVNQWQIITESDMNFIEENDGKTLFFPSAIKKFSGQVNSQILIKRPTGFYVFSTSPGHATLQKIDNVFIFNFDTKKYEELDASQYHYISEGLRIYKNRVYGDDGLPVKEPIDAGNLHFITHHGKKTNYLTDGKSLIYIGNTGGYASEGEGDNIMQVLGKQIISRVDFSTLKVITKDILMDKENFYNGNYDGIGIIPIKALNLKVKIFTE